MVDKSQTNANTRKQELTSAWIFRRALKDNKKYKKWEDIMDDPLFVKEVIGTKTRKGIYPDVTKDWLENFYLQQKKFLEEFSNAKFTEFTREYGFMKYISDLVKKQYGISKKDAWDPADIWCVQNEKKVIDDINKIVKSGGLNSLEELNALLRTLFKERRVVGVSLKKVTGNQAYYEEVNVKDKLEFKNSNKPSVDVYSMKVDLLFDTSKGKYSAEGAEIKFTAMEGKQKLEFTIQIRTVSSSRLNRLSLSIQEKGAASQIGRVPIKMVLDEFVKRGLKYSNDPKDYPVNVKEFNTDVNLYKKMFNSMKSVVATQIDNDKDFVSGLNKAFVTKAPIANSKLMQLKFFSELSSLKKKDIDMVITSLFFFAQKKGKGFGPFGKIY